MGFLTISFNKQKQVAKLGKTAPSTGPIQVVGSISSRSKVAIGASGAGPHNEPWRGGRRPPRRRRTSGRRGATPCFNGLLRDLLLNIFWTPGAWNFWKNVGSCVKTEDGQKPMHNSVELSGLLSWLNCHRISTAKGLLTARRNCAHVVARKALDISRVFFSPFCLRC